MLYVRHDRLSGLCLIAFLCYVIYISYILISMPRPKTDYIRYVCNFTIKQYEALKDKSDEEGIPIAHQVRTAINEYIKN